MKKNNKSDKGGQKFRRLDVELVARNLSASRAQAQDAIDAGLVAVNKMTAKKSALVSDGDLIEIAQEAQNNKWMSRGAHKLIKGLDFFSVSPQGMTCADIGASTGGFTQVLLSRGAACVFAVDVGYGQLAWALQNDPRVRVLDRVNARFLSSLYPDMREMCDLAVCDASFISLRLLLPSMDFVLKPDGAAIVLIKPQFEAGRGSVGKKGVVLNADTHRKVLENLCSHINCETAFSVMGLTPSPIKGREGNIEFLCYIKKGKYMDEIEKLSDKISITIC